MSSPLNILVFRGYLAVNKPIYHFSKSLLTKSFRRLTIEHNGYFFKITPTKYSHNALMKLENQIKHKASE